MDLAVDSIFKPVDDITWRDVDGEIVVLKLDTGEYYTFNELGRKVWLHLSAGDTINQTVQSIITEYEVDMHQADNDVKKFARGLLGHSLIVQHIPNRKEG